MAQISSKNDLIKRVEEQQTQLQRYEKRLRDVVVAYKNLQKEKETLELSLKAITSVNPDTSATDGPILKQRVDETESNFSSQNSDVAMSGAKEGLQANDQLATLTRAITTLTDQKSKMEANFQADKKRLKQEKEELLQKLSEERQDWKRIKQGLQNQLTELRQKLWAQQMDREKEQNNHGIMLRELQTLVAIERSAKEQLEVQLEDVQNNLDRKAPVQQKCEEYQSKIQQLSNELQGVRDRLKLAEDKSCQPQPLLLQLQQEMETMKTQHQVAVLQEKHRANEAEEQLQQIAKVSEERVAGLEAKLSELSETVGNYDRMRQQDQEAIHKLKERVSQLDVENSALAAAAGATSSANIFERDKDEENLDIQALLEKMMKLKGMLSIANRRSENPVDLEEFFKREGLLPDANHESCKEDLHQLKEEFERYKVRAQSVLKNKNVKDSYYSKETDVLKNQVAELRSKVRSLTTRLDESEKERQKSVDDLKTSSSNLRSQHAQELSRLESEYKARIGDMENQMQKQRERTLSLLAEKDNDIKLLKMSLGILRNEFETDSPAFASSNGEENPCEAKDMSDMVFSEEFSHLLTTGRNDGPLLHYVQESARKDKEISVLRRAKHELETALRELQAMMVAKDEKHGEEVENLKSEIYRLDRNCSREGANLEYLKNVVLNYITSSDASGRQHMLNAIAALLKFSPKELQSVRQYNASWWWPSTPKTDQSAGLKG